LIVYAFRYFDYINDYICMYFRSFPRILYIDSPPPYIYTLSLHDALPICHAAPSRSGSIAISARNRLRGRIAQLRIEGLMAEVTRSEEHTSELQSRGHLVCRPLLAKKKNNSHSANASSYSISTCTALIQIA